MALYSTMDSPNHSTILLWMARRASSRDRAARADNPPDRDRDARRAGGGGLGGGSGGGAVAAAASAAASGAGASGGGAAAAGARVGAGARRGALPAARPSAPHALHAARPDVLLLYMGSVLYGQLLLLDGQVRSSS